MKIGRDTYNNSNNNSNHIIIIIIIIAIVIITGSNETRSVDGCTYVNQKRDTIENHTMIWQIYVTNKNE